MHTSCTLYSFTPYIQREQQDINKRQNKTKKQRTTTKNIQEEDKTHSLPQCTYHNIYIYMQHNSNPYNVPTAAIVEIPSIQYTHMHAYIQRHT